jgi:hypothetical protein
MALMICTIEGKGLAIGEGLVACDHPEKRLKRRILVDPLDALLGKGLRGFDGLLNPMILQIRLTPSQMALASLALTGF